MQDIRINKLEALEILRANRAAHQKIFLEALEGYRTHGIKILEDHLTELRAGRSKRVQVILPEPMNQTTDYDRAIRMLEMCVDDTVLMDETSFAQYIQDDWSWKRQFLHSNAAYSATAATLSGE